MLPAVVTVAIMMIMLPVAAGKTNPVLDTQVVFLPMCLLGNLVIMERTAVMTWNWKI